MDSVPSPLGPGANPESCPRSTGLLGMGVHVQDQTKRLRGPEQPGTVQCLHVSRGEQSQEQAPVWACVSPSRGSKCVCDAQCFVHLLLSLIPDAGGAGFRARDAASEMGSQKDIPHPYLPQRPQPLQPVWEVLPALPPNCSALTSRSTRTSTPAPLPRHALQHSADPSRGSSQGSASRAQAAFPGGGGGGQESLEWACLTITF